MSLKQLQLKTILNTSQDDVMAEFFIPALMKSVRYDRGVGFFSAAWLKIAAEGMVEFAANSGQARWITSPILSREDWEALKLGEDAKYDAVLKAALECNIDDLAEALSTNTLSALAWLIADNIIEFRLAVPRNKLESGEFHDKFGIFTDSEGNQVSFSGSNNESIQGTVNYESFKVFSSWNEALAPFVQDDMQRFERLWNNLDSNLQVFALPEAARAKILKLRTQERPYPDPYPAPSLAQIQGQLWEHQEAAILAWEANQRIGILSMATGSGKTLAAIHAAMRCNPMELLLIAVPRANLVTQWAEEVVQHSDLQSPILVFENRKDWQDKLFNRLLSAKVSTSDDRVVVIGTMASLSSQAFDTILADTGVPQHSLLIIDEVHNVGAPTYRKIMRTDIGWRLGLSATPLRHFDEVGNHAIDEYFGKTVYTYSLAQALRDGRLTPYHYDVFPVYMLEAEYEEYRNLTARIIALRGKLDGSISYQTDNSLDEDQKDIEKLLFARARIIKKCAEKDVVLEQIFRQYPPRRCLVYCADQEQLASVSVLLNQQKVVHLSYTSQHSTKEREQALSALEDRIIPVLLAIDCLDEGVDIPIVDQAVILASSGNMRQFIQRRGRVLRRAEGKKRAILIDAIVLPPHSVGHEGRNMLYGELARSKEMASLAQNSYAILNKISDLIRPYGILLTEFISGERYE